MLLGLGSQQQKVGLAAPALALLARWVRRLGAGTLVNVKALTVCFARGEVNG